jgi:endonuclease/exonuclease/phosphatase family metal-dependent hydrolase
VWRVTESVSVATYNLYLGADLSLLLGERPRDELATNLAEVERQLLATAFPRRATHIARSLAEREADLVGLQEVCCWTVSERQVWDFTALLLGELREHGVEYETVSEVATFSGEGELPGGGTELPLHVRGSNVVLRRVGSPVTVTDEGHGLFDEALQVYSFGTRVVAIARGWCGVRCELGGRSFAFIDTHTEAYGPASRNRQRDELMAACDRWADPLVLVGDFNASPDQVGMPPDLVDAWSVNGDAPGPTCCQGPDLTNEESMLQERIDYVWVRGARVRSAELLGAQRSVRDAAGMWPSDHAGVHAVVELD